MAAHHEKLIDFLDEWIKDQTLKPSHVKMLQELQYIVRWAGTLRGIFIDMGSAEPEVCMLGVEDIGSYPTAVCAEQLPGELSRVVFKVPTHYAERLRQKLHVPLQPAPMEGTEAMIRAAHSLAGAAIEVSETLKSLREKLR